MFKTYSQRVWCENCKNHVPLKIPKGTSVKDHKASAPCPRCGCVGFLWFDYYGDR